MKLTNKEIGYIAGIIDGEGSICINSVKNSERNTIYYRPFIKIANTNLELLIWIKNKLGAGRISVDQEQSQCWKAVYTLRFSAKMIRTFLPTITDSLIVKRKQAILLGEFLNICHRGNGRNFKKDNDHVYKYYHQSLKSLNHRGTSEKGSEFGGTPAKDNPEPSMNRNIQGVCNEQVLPSKEMICSELTGNRKSVAEMTTPILG